MRARAFDSLCHGWGASLRPDGFRYEELGWISKPTTRRKNLRNRSSWLHIGSHAKILSRVLTSNNRHEKRLP